MPYAANGQISQSPITGGIKISQALYLAALEGMQAGKVVSIVAGAMVVDFPPAPEPEPEPEPPVQTLTELKAAKFAALSAQRFAVETGGTSFGEVPIRTDRETCSIITAAYVSAISDPDYIVPNWKVADGVFVPLDAATIIAISTIVRAHVQATFDHEAEVSALIVAAENEEDLDAVDIETGW